jgi:gluconokinase
MRAGRPLDDQDRLPWLGAVGAWLGAHPDGAVVSCSALRHDYRDRLRDSAPDAVFLHLAGDADVVTARVAARSDHFMPASLVGSQLELLEPLGSDEAGLVADLTSPVDELVDEFTSRLGITAVAATSGGTR